MREAIRLVREEQGADAVILSNRRVPGGVEVVAATDYDAALVQSAAQRSLQAQAPAVPESYEDAPLSIAASSKTAALAVPTAEPAPVAVPPPSPAVAVAPSLTPDSLAAVSRAVESNDQLNREIQTLRALIEEQLASLRWGDMQKHRPRQAEALRTMVNLGLEPELARSIAEELPEGTDADRARFLPLGLLSRRLPVNGQDPVLDGGVIALVGPTGVGKTTTIAKLAARYASVHGVRDIALITADHYRIGAQEQLFTYGRLLGVPVHAVGRDDSLTDLLERLSDRRLVLIDTAGLSQNDRIVATQMQQIAAASAAIKTWLVIAGNAQPGVQHDAVRYFGSIPLDGCVISKLDEAHRIGGALSVAIRHRLSIHYYTDGQRVPEDLHLGRADRLVLQATQLARQSAAQADESQLISGFSSANANGQ